jgi:hypothetical protein
MAPITGYRDGGERYLDPVTAKRRIGDRAARALECQLPSVMTAGGWPEIRDSICMTIGLIWIYEERKQIRMIFDRRIVTRFWPPC